MWAEIKEYEGKYWVNENGENKNGLHDRKAERIYKRYL